MAALKDRSGVVQYLATRCLVQFVNQRKKDFVAILSQREGEKRWGGAQILSHLPNPSEDVVKAVVKLLKDKKEWVQQGAAQCLLAFGAVAIPHLTKIIKNKKARSKHRVQASFASNPLPKRPYWLCASTLANYLVGRTWGHLSKKPLPRPTTLPGSRHC